MKLKDIRRKIVEGIKNIGKNIKDDFNRFINMSLKDMVTVTVKQLFGRMEMV